MNTKKIIQKQTITLFYSKFKIIFIYVGDKVVTFETIDNILNYSSDLGFNFTNYPFAYSEEIFYVMLHQKYIPVQEVETSTKEKRVPQIR